MTGSNLKIWVIENFEKKEIPKSEYGKFYTGDSYLILKEKKNRNGQVAYDLHMWIGEKSTQDEYGACAILATQLDDELGGLPVQYRETQRNESSNFLGYFKPAIQYKIGGSKSGFHHVTINDFSEVKRLLWVRGRQQVRADEVELEWSSLNKADCFIFDMGNKIYVWNGPKSNPFERIQAMKVAKSISQSERGGKVSVVSLDQDTSKLKKFLGEQHGDISDGEDEAPGTKVYVKAGTKIQLYKVSDSSGKLKTTLVGDKPPFKQCMLQSGDVFLVNNTNAGEIFVWKGKGASAAERKESMKTAISFIDEFSLPKNTKITVMAENGETALFKALFQNWQEVNSQVGLGNIWSVNKVAKVKKVNFDASTLLKKPNLAAKYQLPDDGSGSVQIYRVEGSGLNQVDSSTYGAFYGGDCYIIAYTYKSQGPPKTILYYWIGAKASKDEITALPILTIQMDNNEYNGNATQIRVTQGHEPPHLLHLFGGKPMIINLGGTSRSGGDSKAASKRLFHVKSGVMGRCRAVEVTAKSSNLNSNDTFVLKTPSSCYLWIGKGATDEEKVACESVAKLVGAGKATEVEEESEPDSFWDELGGKSSYYSNPILEDQDLPLRLFECSDASGNFVVEEVVGDWSQQDLNSDNVMLLDAWSALYIWIGNGASENEKKEAMKTAANYLDLDSSERNSNTTSIIKLKQGQEPTSFSGFFQGWE